MDGERIPIFVVLCLMCLTMATQAQKAGFRGGSKSYEVHVEANTMGTNLHYELPEAKVKAASKQDWQVENDNADMFAMNSPILAMVNVKHPKFSMKGQWPEYKTSFKLPKDVNVASKRADFSKFIQGENKKVGKTDSDLHDEDFSGNAKTSRDHRTDGHGVSLSNLAGRLFAERKSGKKKPIHDDGLDLSKISRLLLPIAGMKNADLNNPRLSNAVKGVIKNARKVVDEAKSVLNDAANFVTKVRKLVKVTKDHSKIHRQFHKVIAMETSPKKQSDGNLNSVTQTSKTSQEQSKTKSAGLKVAETSKGKESELKNRKTSLQQTVDTQKHDNRVKHSGKGDNEAKIGAKDVSKRSYLGLIESPDERKNKRKSRVHRRGLAETLESILSTINRLKGLSGSQQQQR